MAESDEKIVQITKLIELFNIKNSLKFTVNINKHTCKVTDQQRVIK